MDARRSRPRAPPTASAPCRTTCATPCSNLGWIGPFSMDVLKARYKELAKRHHPDANGGDRASEERLKTINLAYAAVRHYLNAEPRMAAAG